MVEYIIAPAARLDLINIWGYFAGEVGDVSLADRFADQARLTFAKLARNPGLGRSWQSTRPELVGLHVWRVDSFPKLLIFYRERARMLEVARVIHGARDLDAALSSQPPSAPED